MTVGDRRSTFSQRRPPDVKRARHCDHIDRLFGAVLGKMPAALLLSRAATRPSDE
jgi:hypothetical protein